MRFVSIESVRGLEIDQPVFTKDKDGLFGYGKLIKEEKTKDGIARTFEMGIFEEQYKIRTKESGGFLKMDITHVCIPK